MDGIFHLVRGFENDEIVHVDDSVDPVRYALCMVVRVSCLLACWMVASLSYFKRLIEKSLSDDPNPTTVPIGHQRSDLETITGELCLKDLATIERALEAAKVEHKRVKVRCVRVYWQWHWACIWMVCGMALACLAVAS